MKAILPAAGYATRLYPLTENMPKALLPINEKPVIEFIIQKILGIPAVDEIIVVTNNKFFPAFEKWVRTRSWDVPITIINDGTRSNEERFGTMGDVRYVIDQKKIDEDILIINADNLFSFTLTGSYTFFQDVGDVIGLYDVKDLEITKKMGHTQMNEEGKINFFKEKDQKPSSSVCSIGIYFYQKATLALLKKYLDDGGSPDKSGEFVEWLYKEKDIHGFSYDANDFWFDIGSLEDYEEAQIAFKDRKETRSQ